MQSDAKQPLRYTVVDDTSTSNPACGLPRLQVAIGTVMHTTSGTNSLRILQGLDGSGVSVHTLIDRDGTRHALYPPAQVCFHTGATWLPQIPGGLYDVANALYLGIELECLDTQAPTLQQYDSAAEQIATWALTLGWRWPYNVLGHYGIATPLGRRSDPVRFDWGGFAGRLLYWSRALGVPGVD